MRAPVSGVCMHVCVCAINYYIKNILSVQYFIKNMAENEHKNFAKSLIYYKNFHINQTFCKKNFPFPDSFSVHTKNLYFFINICLTRLALFVTIYNCMIM